MWQIVCVIPFLNQALNSSDALRRSSPYSLYCLVAARFPPRFHLDLEMELLDGYLKSCHKFTGNGS